MLVLLHLYGILHCEGTSYVLGMHSQSVFLGFSSMDFGKCFAAGKPTAIPTYSSFHMCTEMSVGLGYRTLHWHQN